MAFAPIAPKPSANTAEVKPRVTAHAPVAPRTLGSTTQIVPNAVVGTRTGTISMGEVLRQQLAATEKKANDIQMTCAAYDALIPIIYGERVVGGLIANVLTWWGYWLFWIVWCEGEVNSFEEVSMNDAPLPASALHLANVGLQTTYDNYVHDAFMQLDPPITDFAEVCSGLCYSVILIPFGDVTAPPTFTARIRGRKVYDPRSATTAWSFNPALILADFLTNTTWGAGKQVDWDSVTACANANDVDVGNGEKKRTACIVIDREASVDSWIETLRAAASCSLVRTQDTFKLIPDVWDDEQTVTSYSHAAGQIIELAQPSIRSASQLPTVIEVQYTDTTTTPWQTVSADPVKLRGVQEGTIAYRKSVVPMPWITTASQARREAYERLNKLWVRALTFNLHIFDEGLQHELGDVVSVTYPEAGFTALLMRVIGIQPTDLGWVLTLERHDKNAYSNDVVETAPEIPNTQLPDPNTPPAPTGLAANEDVYQQQTGVYSSRLRITWDDMRGDDEHVGFPFLAAYRVTVQATGADGLVNMQGPVLTPANATEFVTAPLPEGYDYYITVEIVSVTGIVGVAATTNYTNLGRLKLALPSDVPSFSGFEVGGDVRLEWGAATDFDLSAYVIRYGPVGCTWESGSYLLARVAAPATTYVFSGNTAVPPIAAGTWRFWIKALDSVRTETNPYGQESANAISCDIEATSDTSAFVATSHTFATPKLFNLSVFSGGGYVTDFGDSWNVLFPNAMSTYTNPIFTYHTAGTSGYVTETFDANLTSTGDWSADFYYTNLAGTADAYLELCETGPESPKTITAASGSPIACTCTAHGYATGDEVEIAGATGNTNCNGLRLVTKIDANSFALRDLFGNFINSNGTLGGTVTVKRWVWSRFSARMVKSTARYARLRLQTTGTVWATALGSVRCNVVARDEGGTATTSATGPAMVVFASRYSRAVSVQVTPRTTVPLTTAYDNVEVDGARGMDDWATGGRALRFDGLSDYVTIADSVPLSPTAQMTLEFMVLAQLTGAAEFRCPICKWDWNTSSSWAVQVHQITGGVFFNVATAANDTNGNNYMLCNAGALASGRWARVSIVYNGALAEDARAVVYVDGAAASVARVGSIPSALINSTAPIEFGRFTNIHILDGGSADRWFPGEVDDVRVWNVARTQEQIKAALRTPLIGTESNLVGYWKCDSNDGTIAYDATSNANHGTVNGAKWRPLNGMDLYAFNAAGNKVANAVSWIFNGV